MGRSERIDLNATYRFQNLLRPRPAIYGLPAEGGRSSLQAPRGSGIPASKWYPDDLLLSEGDSVRADARSLDYAGQRGLGHPATDERRAAFEPRHRAEGLT